jgi:hypothetical protein
VIPGLSILLLASLVVKIYYHFSYLVKTSSEELNYLEFLAAGLFKNPLQWLCIHCPFFIVSSKGKYRTITAISVAVFWTTFL